jgi:hypothetical protein
MIRDQDDSKSVLVAIEAAEPLENGLGVPRLLGSKVHAASLVARDCHWVVYGRNIRPRPTAAQHHFRERTDRSSCDRISYGPVVRRVELSRFGTPGPMETRMKHTDATVPAHGCQGADAVRSEGRNSLTGLDKGTGVSDGVRTRDFRSHSPALYH